MKKIIFWGTTLLIIIYINFLIINKENIIKNGQSVLLELAPVDPRSLIQGDYMRLRYAIARKLPISGRITKGNASRLSQIPKEKLETEGYIILALDTNNVGRFVKIYHGGNLLSNQHLLFYRNRKGLQLGAETFMFQEGNASLYSKAKYGELKVDDSGKSVLIGLRDKNFHRLEKKNLH